MFKDRYSLYSEEELNLGGHAELKKLLKHH